MVDIAHWSTIKKHFFLDHLVSSGVSKSHKNTLKKLCHASPDPFPLSHIPGIHALCDWGTGTHKDGRYSKKRYHVMRHVCLSELTNTHHGYPSEVLLDGSDIGCLHFSSKNAMSFLWNSRQFCYNYQVKQNTKLTTSIEMHPMWTTTTAFVSSKWYTTVIKTYYPLVIKVYSLRRNI